MRPTTTSWKRVFLLFAIGVLAAGQLGMMPPIMPSLQRDFQMSLAGAGLAVSVITLVGAAIGVFAGAWCERVGHVHALRFGTVIMALAAGFCAMVEDGTAVLVARGVAGVGYLLVVVAAPSLMAHAASRRDQPAVLSLWSTFVPTGIAVAGVLSAMFTDRIGWRAIFMLDAVALLAALATSTILRHDNSSKDTAPSAMSIGQLRAPALLSLTFFCFALIFLALASLLPTHLVDARGLQATEAGRIVAVSTASGIVGSFVCGWMMRRGSSPGRLAAIGLIASTLIAVLAINTKAEIVVAVVAIAASFIVGGLVPAAVFASVPLLARDRRAIGPINGLVAQSGSLGSLAGPPLLAIWVGWVGWASAPIPLLVVAAVGGACALAIARPSD